jgi:hypothetical protein
VGERGRLLERLEQPVARRVVHRLGALDDEDAPRGLERRVVDRGDHGLLTSATSISAAPVGATHVRSGWTPSLGAARGPRGIGAPSASSAPAKARAAARLPAPAGPWKR